MIVRDMKESQSSLLHVHLCVHCSAYFEGKKWKAEYIRRDFSFVQDVVQKDR
jgi:NMD protein affecting ribosome stability and mRNA decay